MRVFPVVLDVETAQKMKQERSKRQLHLLDVAERCMDVAVGYKRFSHNYTLWMDMEFAALGIYTETLGHDVT